MRPLLPRVSRSTLENFTPRALIQQRASTLRLDPSARLTTCIQCQYRAYSARQSRSNGLKSPLEKPPTLFDVRQWSSGTSLRREEPASTSPDKRPAPKPDQKRDSFSDTIVTSDTAIPLPEPS